MERGSEQVGGREVLGRYLFRLLLQSGGELGYVINWGVNKRCFLCLLDPIERIVQLQRR